MISLADYDIEKAFKAIEDELMASMIRNMKRHRIEEVEEQKEWAMWQAMQLESLEKYKRENRKKFQSQFSDINGAIESIIGAARIQGNMDQEIAILNAIRKGFKPKSGLKRSTQISGEFFKLNDRKLEALIRATQNDFKKAEQAMLRMADDQYRKAIFNAQVYASTGAGTYEKAVDMATKDFISRGVNCIEYANGARHTIAEYADMAIRTASKRAYLTGEGEKRQEWGISLVILKKRGNACPKCLPFVGKVLIDDVWSGGKQSDGPYMLMSTAMSRGLYHPRCKDIHTTYFEGISTPGAAYTKEELQEIEESYRKDQKQQYAKRQEERFGRLAKYSLDEDNRQQYRRKESIWKKAKKMIDTAREHKPIQIKDLEKRYRDDIFSILDKAEPRVKNVFLKYNDKVVFINERAVGTAVSRKNGIRVNLKNDMNDVRGSYTSTFHEMGHCIDRADGWLSYKDTKFKDALQNDFDNLVNTYMKVYNVNQDQAYLMIGKGLQGDEYHSISDITGALSENKCVGNYSHSADYWKRKHALEKESFAHFFEAYARNDIEKIEAISQVFPNAVQEFINLLE